MIKTIYIFVPQSFLKNEAKAPFQLRPQTFLGFLPCPSLLPSLFSRQHSLNIKQSPPYLQIHFLLFQLIFFQCKNIKQKISEININFTLHAILSIVIKLHIIPLHPSQDVIHPFVQHIHIIYEYKSYMNNTLY